jgi:hypothetical protein
MGIGYRASVRGGALTAMLFLTFIGMMSLAKHRPLFFGLNCGELRLLATWRYERSTKHSP